MEVISSRREPRAAGALRSRVGAQDREAAPGQASFRGAWGGGFPQGSPPPQSDVPLAVGLGLLTACRGPGALRPRRPGAGTAQGQCLQTAAQSSLSKTEMRTELGVGESPWGRLGGSVG